MRVTAAVCAASLTVMGCAQKSENIEASYLPTTTYSNLSCTQIEAEAVKVTKRANEVAGIQDQKASEDATATGVAIVLFWPAAFFIKGDEETAAEVANLKGQLDALERVSNEKNCGIVFQDVTPQKPVKTDSAETESENGDSTDPA